MIVTKRDGGEAPPRRKRPPSASRARQQARRLAVQALYQDQINPASVHELVAEFRVHHESDDADLEYFAAAVTGVSRAARELDTLYAPLLDRALDELDPVERAILRLGT
ncbi:MAG: N utilization substance protein B, partial [Gammaproteobacteria bacterium]